MNRRARRRGRSLSQAFTLVEMMLVLAIVAVVGAFGLATLQRPLSGQRLCAAADEVRTSFCHRGSWPWSRAARWRSATRSTATVIACSRKTIRRRRPRPRRRRRPNRPPRAAPPRLRLPRPPRVRPTAQRRGATGICPRESASWAPTKARRSVSAAAVMPEAAPADETNDNWSDPILFYPDGTTSDARVVLATETSRTLELVLRGVTGLVSVNDPVTAVQ